jgi:hypothetical protein
MVPYFGKHSAKMFMKMKPVRFGFKLWVLAATDGYPYALQIYTGKTIGNVKQPLGFRVVESLLQPVKDLSEPGKHTVYFDNFFTSYDLMSYLLKDLKPQGRFVKIAQRELIETLFKTAS